MSVRTDTDEPATPEAGGGGLVRLRLDLAYDGTGFAGWARQPAGLRTVQAVVEDALGAILHLPVPPSLVVAGRTDAGVHAQGQVAHVDLPAPVGAGLDLGVLLRRLAGALPRDVRVRGLVHAPAGFDARFSALSRRYAYRVCDDPTGVAPLRRHEVLWHPRPLDVAAMNQACAPLLGEHDFAAFCRRREGATTIRALERLGWARHDDGLVVATVVADAFCHSMVRALVGCLLAVGEGRRPVEWPAQVLAAEQRDPTVNVVGPVGLTLEAVAYPPDLELAGRAERTRAPRGPRAGPAPRL